MKRTPGHRWLWSTRAEAYDKSTDCTSNCFESDIFNLSDAWLLSCFHSSRSSLCLSSLFLRLRDINLQIKTDGFHRHLTIAMPSLLIFGATGFIGCAYDLVLQSQFLYD